MFAASRPIAEKDFVASQPNFFLRDQSKKLKQSKIEALLLDFNADVVFPFSDSLMFHVFKRSA